MRGIIHYLVKIIIFLTFAHNLNAQVTIGVDEDPTSGALLQLKNKSGINTADANATKGLNLPRVELTDMTKLYPMFENDNNYVNNIGGAQKTQNDLHIGLTVYSVNNNICKLPYYSEGVYVWNGQNWDYLGIPDANIMTFLDQDKNPFKARRFGAAGVWMIENLRAKTYANGSTPPTLNSAASLTEKYYCYPAPLANSEGITDGTNDKYFKTQPSMGLFYNKAAVLNGENTSTNEQGQVVGDTPGPDEVESVAPNGRIQGICPDNWHVPSDREWNELEEEIYNKPEKYSSYTKEEAQSWNPSQWNSQWETINWSSNVLRGSSTGEGHGRAMMSPCPLPESPYQGTYIGKSLISYMGGFDALLIGTAYKGGLSMGIEQYGYATYFWSSSTSFSGMMSWYRGIGVINGSRLHQGVMRHTLLPGGPEALLSVRCKKNEN